MLCYVMLCYVKHVMLCYVKHVMSCYVMLCYVKHVMLCYVVLCYVKHVMLCYVMLWYVKHVMLFTKTKINLSWTLLKSTQPNFKDPNPNNETQNTKFWNIQMCRTQQAGTPRTNDYASILVLRSYTRSHTQNSERTEHLATLLHTAVMLGILTLYSALVTICTAQWSLYVPPV